MPHRLHLASTILQTKHLFTQVVVLARELGLEVELSDVHGEGLLPRQLETWVADRSEGAPRVGLQLAEALKPYDGEVAARLEALMKGGKVAAQLSAVNLELGVCSVALTSLEPENPIARCRGNENIVAIHTARYSEAPMILMGPGAGAEITASGMYSDLLRLSRTLVEHTIRRPV